MAIIAPGTFCEGLSGSTGCVTFRTRRRGGVVGMKSRGPRRTSAAQQAHRRVFSRASRAWQALGDADRQAWIQWADEWGSLADPPKVGTASGRERFIGSFTMCEAAGLPVVTTPSNAGLAGAARAYLDFTPSETDSTTSIVMLFQLPPQPGTPTRAIVSLTPPRPLSRRANYGDFRQVAVLDLDGAQPGFGLPPVVIDDGRACPPGWRRWARTRMVDSVGYTGPERVVPVLQVQTGQTRAFKVRVQEPFAGQVFLERTPDDRLTLSFVVSETPVELEWDLGPGGLTTVGAVAGALGSTGILQLREERFAEYGRPATDIPVIPAERLSLRYQPFPVPVPA